MKTKLITFSCTIFLFLTLTCNQKKEVPAKQETATLAISGMTCEIGCAKTIASKLSKKEGVVTAAVVFKDSIATITYDANKLNTNDLITFVNGIADGKTYKASEVK